MAFIYEVSFDVQTDRMADLQIGASLERVLGYLRTLLPSYTGFMNARAMYSLDNDEQIRIVFESAWDAWEDLVNHSQSALVEDKVLVEFDPQIDRDQLTIRVYEEAA